jgi:AcrR family transcriptional regulator
MNKKKPKQKKAAPTTTRRRSALRGRTNSKATSLARTSVNPERKSIQRQEFLNSACAHVLVHGAQDFSLRAIAAEIGTSHRTLIYYFDSAGEFWQALIDQLRHKEHKVALAEVDWTDLESAVLSIWTRYSSKDRLPFVRFMFERFGRAMQDPARFEVFLDDVVLGWLLPLEEIFTDRYKMELTEIRSHLRLAVAVFRGLLFDLLATNDLQSTTAAIKLFAKSLSLIPALHSSNSSHRT